MPVGSLLATDASALQHNAVHQPCIYPTALCNASALHSTYISPASNLHQPCINPTSALHKPYISLHIHANASALNQPRMNPTKSCSASALQQPYIIVQCISPTSALHNHAVHQSGICPTDLCSACDLDSTGLPRTCDVESAVNDCNRSGRQHQSGSCTVLTTLTQLACSFVWTLTACRSVQQLVNHLVSCLTPCMRDATNTMIMMYWATIH